MYEKRKFLNLNRKQQISHLFNCLNLAIREHPELCDMNKHRTDLIGIACHYGQREGVKREDFDEILSFKLGTLVKLFNENF